MSVALVTGAASGIGAAIVQRLRGDGWDVLSVDLRGGVDLHVDLTERQGNADAVAAARERYGQIDAVIPNAGFQHVAPVAEFSEDRWDGLIALLLTSPFLLRRYAWEDLRRSDRGRFVVIASIHALVPPPTRPPTSQPSTGCWGWCGHWPSKGRRTRSASPRCARANAQRERLRVHGSAGDHGPGVERQMIAQLERSCTAASSGGQWFCKDSRPMKRPRWPPALVSRSTSVSLVAA